MKLSIHFPVKPFGISQRFAENIPCVKDFGLPTQKIIDGTQGTCPVGYDKLYQHWGMSGHNGTDVFAGIQPVYAAVAGTVIEMQTAPARGLGLGILSDEEFQMDCGTHFAKLRYWHLQSFSAKLGDHVEVGQQIGITDSTGYSSGNHLHFELQPMDKDRGGHPKLTNPQGHIAGAVALEPYLNGLYANDERKKALQLKTIELLKALLALLRK
jgi:murein DD-endopeptidase MepM/ murein hydrolase activator NlpD